MTTGFPLVLLPKRIVYVDDDGRMLDILRMTMPAEMSREFIGSPDTALAELSQETGYWRSIEALLARGYKEGAAGANEAQTYVTSYFQDWRRFHLTGVLIVDYAMPGLTGVDLLQRLPGFPGRRVLLTGQADAEVAVQAFNSGLIQKFIPKATPNLYKELTRSTDEMHRDVCEHLGHLLRSSLQPSQVELLFDPAVVKGLADKVEELDWMEYVVVGNPFGLLGMSHGGPLQWLQIETADSLKDLATALPDAGYPQEDVRAVASCTAAPVAEIRRQLGIRDNRQLVPTDDIASSPEVYCAVVDLPVDVLTAREYGVDDIRTPEELMRALLRDVSVASARVKAAPSDAGVQRGLEEAIAHVVRIATFSHMHARGLAPALGASRLDPDLIARIQTQVSITMAGKKHGPPR